MERFDLTFLSLFQVSTIHTLNKKKNTAPWYRSNTAVALFLRQIFAMRATLFEQLQVYCLHMYKHALFRWFNLIRHFHDITIFYFLFFFGCSFSFLFFPYPDAGKVHPASKKPLHVHIAGGSELYSSILLLLDLCRNNERKMR